VPACFQKSCPYFTKIYQNFKRRYHKN